MSHTYKINENVNPQFIIFTDFYTKQKQLNCVTWSNDMYNIDEYHVVVDNDIDNNLEEIILFNVIHPNAFVPDTKIHNLKFIPEKVKFCMADEIKGAKVNEITLKSIRFMLASWNLDSAHFWPNLASECITYDGQKLPTKNPFERR